VVVSVEWIGANRIGANGAPPRGRQHAFVALGALLLVAAALALPAALGPVRLNDSFWIDLVWLEQFAQELGKGTLYPRWLPLSHNGLGSPVFYYYPPLAFYLASGFALAGLSTFSALIAAFATASLLSGVGVYFWLRPQSRAALPASLLFMVAPYQLFNFYQRGAIAEFLATAIVPFVLIGIRWMLEERRGGAALAALTYAALVMSHLPLTLLASLFLFAPFVLVKAWKSPMTMLRIGAALALGLAASAVYLVPAIALEPYRSSADLWTLHYLQPATWNLWSAEAWSDQTYRAVLLVGAALAVPSAGLIIRERSPWAVWAVLCLAIGVGIAPIIWKFPLLRFVQFPFRLLPIAELAFVTAAALGARNRVPWLMIWVSFLLMAGFIIAAKPDSANFGDRVMREVHPDVPENLPPGKRPYSWPSKWALDIGAEHRSARFDGKITSEPVFFYPSWEVHCGARQVSTFPDPRTQLLAYEGRACTRKLVPTMPELVGALASLAALLVISLTLLSSSPGQRRSRRREIRLRNT
jgi:hypothetical protein